MWYIIYPCFLRMVQVPPLGGVRGLPVSAVLYVAVRSASAYKRTHTIYIYPPPPSHYFALPYIVI